MKTFGSISKDRRKDIKVSVEFSIFCPIRFFGEKFSHWPFTKPFSRLTCALVQGMETANIQSKDILLAYHISGTPSLTFIVSSHPYRVYRIIYLPRLSFPCYFV